MGGQQAVYEALGALGVEYERVEHEPVYTIEDMQRLGLSQRGTVAKNLFLRDAKGKRHFLVMLREDKAADLKALEQTLGSTRLSFASEERLQKHLGLEKGAVTPFGVLNDEAHAVEVVVDSDLENAPCVGVHPNENTATLFLPFEGIKKLLAKCGNAVRYVQIG